MCICVSVCACMHARTRTLYTNIIFTSQKIIQFSSSPFDILQVQVNRKSSFWSAYPEGFCVTTMIFAECQQDMCLRAPSSSNESLTGGGSSMEPNSSTSNRALPGGRCEEQWDIWRSVKVICFCRDTTSSLRFLIATLVRFVKVKFGSQ